MKISEEIGKALSFRMKNVKMKRQRLANLIGRNRSTVGKICNGHMAGANILNNMFNHMGIESISIKWKDECENE